MSSVVGHSLKREIEPCTARAVHFGVLEARRPSQLSGDVVIIATAGAFRCARTASALLTGVA
jgi:hypothetical protein